MLFVAQFYSLLLMCLHNLSLLLSERIIILIKVMKCLAVKVTPGWSYFLGFTNVIAQEMLHGLDLLVSFKTIGYLRTLSQQSGVRQPLIKWKQVGQTTDHLYG